MVSQHDTPAEPSDGACAPRRNAFRARGLELSYLEWGAPEAPPLVMLHGGLENAHAWGPVARRLGARWRIIVPDLRGHGESGWASGGDYGVLDFTSDLAVLFRQLDLPPVMLVGHSLGGAVASYFSALYPGKVDRLCVIEGLRPADHAAPATVETQLGAIRTWVDKAATLPVRSPRIYAQTEPMIARLMAADPLLPEPLARDLALSNIRAVEGGYRWKYDPRVRDMALLTTLGPEPRHFWECIACPTLLVYGAQSWAKSPAQDGRLSFFRNARVAEVADAGHNLHHHQPDAFNALLADFLMG